MLLIYPYPHRRFANQDFVGSLRNATVAAAGMAVRKSNAFGIALSQVVSIRSALPIGRRDLGMVCEFDQILATLWPPRQK
jgi:hypothetical protein